jgi:hypothetical protein
MNEGWNREGAKARMVLVVLITLGLSSCMRARKDEVIAFMGKGAYNGRDFSVVWDHDESVKSVATAVIAGAGLYYGAAQHAASEATTRVVNGNATQQAINANNNATKIASEGIAADVTKAVTIPK